MDCTVIAAPPYVELERIYIITATIKTFKGRRNVDVHLFRPDADPGEFEALSAMDIVEKPKFETPAEARTTEAREDALRTALEAFTTDEGNKVLEYLDKRYGALLGPVMVCPLEMPIPLGVVPLSTIPENRSMGFIRFNEAPNYPLDFAVWGFYDLNAHEPLMPADETGAAQ